MRTLVFAVGAALLVAVATMLFGQNEPAHWLLASVGPGRTLDVFVMDRYFVFAPTLFLVNVIVFGIGRHPTSDSIFIYFLDPDGMTWEYSFGMELFPETNARQPRFMSTAMEDFDVWGARPTPNFGAKGVIEAT